MRRKVWKPCWVPGWDDYVAPSSDWGLQPLLGTGLIGHCLVSCNIGGGIFPCEKGQDEVKPLGHLQLPFCVAEVRTSAPNL